MNLRRMFLGVCLGAAALAAMPAAALVAAEVELQRLAPTDAYSVSYGRTNPERAYQHQYLEDAWQTFRDERIAERVYEIVASRAPEEELAKVKAAWEELAKAVEPITAEALAGANEFLAVSLMEGHVGHTVFAVRLGSDEDAANFRKAAEQLFGVVRKWAGEDEVTTSTSEVGGAMVTRLEIEEDDVPISPVVASLGNIVLISTSDALLERCIAQAGDDSAKSKFDDPRLAEALKALPKSEDSLTFFDVKQMLVQLRGIGDMIRKEKPDDKDAARAAKILEQIMDEVDVVEYEVIVEFTEEGQNRVAAYGKMSEDFESTIVGKSLAGREPLEDWQSWVPADATGYSLSSGLDLHQLYVGVMSMVREEIPEAAEGLAEWEKLQEKVGVNLDEDILQSFSGECASISLPEGQSVLALKCRNPEKIRELLDRAIEGLKQIPPVQQQGLDLADIDDSELEGFQQLKVAALAMTPVKPVIGFHDGWMIIASTPATAKKLLAVRAGDADSIKGAESLEKFSLEVDGPVYKVGYSDIGASIRSAADFIDQAAMMLPMFLGAAAQGMEAEDMKTVQQAIGLLPSIAKVVRKFDFYEQRLGIVRPGPSQGTYLRESATLIRQPSEN